MTLETETVHRFPADLRTPITDPLCRTLDLWSCEEDNVEMVYALGRKKTAKNPKNSLGASFFVPSTSFFNNWHNYVLGGFDSEAFDFSHCRTTSFPGEARIKNIEFGCTDCKKQHKGALIRDIGPRPNIPRSLNRKPPILGLHFTLTPLEPMPKKCFDNLVKQSHLDMCQNNNEDRGRSTFLSVEMQKSDDKNDHNDTYQSASTNGKNIASESTANSVFTSHLAAELFRQYKPELEPEGHIVVQALLRLNEDAASDINDVIAALCLLELIYAQDLCLEEIVVLGKLALIAGQAVSKYRVPGDWLQTDAVLLKFQEHLDIKLELHSDSLSRDREPTPSLWSLTGYIDKFTEEAQYTKYIQSISSSQGNCRFLTSLVANGLGDSMTQLSIAKNMFTAIEAGSVAVVLPAYNNPLHDGQKEISHAGEVIAFRRCEEITELEIGPKHATIYESKLVKKQFTIRIASHNNAVFSGWQMCNYSNCHYSVKNHLYCSTHRKAKGYD